MEQPTATQSKVNLKSVIVYYLLACAISWPFFWWRDINPESWRSWEVPGIIKTWSYMWGPGLSALICLFLFRKTHVRTITFFGTSTVRSLLFYFVPFLLLTIPGLDIPGMSGINPHLVPLVICILGFISILGEELGWRGFLQDALRPLSEVKRYVIIGVMWELWHFTNRTSHGELFQILVRVGVFMCTVIVFSFIIGKATDKSKSLVIAVTLHSWIDFLLEYGNVWLYWVFGVSLVFWTYLLWTWNKKPALDSAA